MKHVPAALPLVLAGALLVALGLPAQAQKSTIQRSRGGESAGSGVSSGSRMHPVTQPRSGLSGGGSLGSRDPLQGAPTLSPDFPRKGREVPPPAEVSGRIQPPPGGELVREDDGPSKGFIRSRNRRTEDEERRWIDDWRGRRSRGDDGVTILVLDPFLYDPYLRYRYFDRYRYASGFGCGFYDRFFPGYYGYPGSYRYRYDPCFSSFGLYLGWPWIADPWPGFWSAGYYPYASGRYGYEYEQGFDAGYSRGYGPGRDQDGESRYDETRESQLGQRYGDEDDYLEPRSPMVSEGRRSMASGDYASALKAFDAYVDEIPEDALGHLSRGLALAALGHYGMAAEAFRTGVDAAAPGYLPGLDMPALLGSRRAFRNVVGDLEIYVRNHADSRDARFVLGVLYLSGGELDAARSLLGGLGGDPYARGLLKSLNDA